VIEVRPFRPEDELRVLAIYQAAFSGPPWDESLPMSTVRSRWSFYRDKRGFRPMVAVMDGQLVGAIWWDTPTLSELATERGSDLALFAGQKLGKGQLIWEREVITHPDYQKQGAATALRKTMLKMVAREKTALVLTRMRQDNLAILKVATNLGFQQTGFTAPSKQPGIVHQYWYKIVTQAE